ncbi:MAG: glycosyltransferase, partial [bacterium]
ERPVILAARGEIRKMMTEAGGALVIDPENTDQMVAAIESVMENPAEAADRARAGRLWVEKDFVRDALARRMAAFLERTLEESRGSPARSPA